MEETMLYPHVTEIVRAGRPHDRFPRTQRELVEFSLRVNPQRTTRPVLECDVPRGIFR
jgi:hypothetical protein